MVRAGHEQEVCVIKYFQTCKFVSVSQEREKKTSGAVFSCIKCFGGRLRRASPLLDAVLNVDTSSLKLDLWSWTSHQSQAQDHQASGEFGLTSSLAIQKPHPRLKKKPNQTMPRTFFDKQIGLCKRSNAVIIFFFDEWTLLIFFFTEVVMVVTGLELSVLRCALMWLAVALLEACNWVVLVQSSVIRGGRWCFVPYGMGCYSWAKGGVILKSLPRSEEYLQEALPSVFLSAEVLKTAYVQVFLLLKLRFFLYSCIVSSIFLFLQPTARAICSQLAESWSISPWNNLL